MDDGPMSHPMGSDHPRKAAAMRFGKDLRKARLAKGLSQKALSRQIGVSLSAISSYEDGNNLPTIERAQILSAGLSAPTLLEQVLESRTAKCENCGRRIVHRSGTNRRYCGTACQAVMQKLREARGTTRERAVAAERQRNVLQECIASFCQACEPEGLCRDAECPLRMGSPLPLARLANDVVPVTPEVYGSAKRWTRPEEREKASVRAKQVWANMSAEEQRELAEKTRRARWKAA